MFERTSQDLLLRQIERFALGFLASLGIKSENGEEDELDAREAESLLGFPLDVVASMDLDALTAFLSQNGEPEAHRMLLTGLLFAHRADQPAHSASDTVLRLKALGLIVRAVEAKPALMSPQVARVLRGLTSSSMQ